MKIVTIIARVLLGLIFVVFGLNGFLHFIPMPPPDDSTVSRFSQILMSTGYMTLVFLCQIVGGLLVLLGFFVPLGLTIPHAGDRKHLPGPRAHGAKRNADGYSGCLARSLPHLALLGKLCRPRPPGSVIIFHDPRCTDYGIAGHPERPARVAASARHLRTAHPDWEWRQPDEAPEEILLRAHSAAHLDQVRFARRDFDADTPAYPDIFAQAARASGAACEVARASLGGETAFSLMRPPGHHATGNQAMGFCFFNHVAVAALDALEQGAERVAIWDFDAHHGNGTEAIVASHPQIAFASVHQFPGYPGTGTRSLGNVHNFPMAPFTPRVDHCNAVAHALAVLLDFKPDLLLVSAGFDAFAGDPITQMSLEPDDFALFGQWLGESSVPAGAILEGGYSDALPQLIDAFLVAWTKSHPGRTR